MSVYGKKQELLEAYAQGKTIQSCNNKDVWTDFVPQNKLDRPNVNYGDINHWRIKPAVIKPKFSFNKLFSIGFIKSKKTYTRANVEAAIDYGAELSLTDNINNSFEYKKSKDSFIKSLKK
jgi:hypothetical protein